MGKRIFTFGCSFTQYVWPTWADIILYKNEGVNLGISGGGFDLIMYRLMEVDRKFKITPDDEIIIIYPTPIRWDLIIGDPPNWQCYGQATTSPLFKYYNDLYNLEGLLFKSFYNISIIHNYLTSKKIKYHCGSINDIFVDVGNYFEELELSSEVLELIKHIKNTVDFDLTNFFSYLNKNEEHWPVTKKFKDYDDYHPLPSHHFLWVKNVLLKNVDIDLHFNESHIEMLETTMNKIDLIEDMCIVNDTYPEFISKRAGYGIYL